MMITKPLIAAMFSAMCVLGPSGFDSFESNQTRTIEAKQDQQDDLFVLTFGQDGLKFDRFVDLYAKMTSHNVMFDARRVSGKTLYGVGTMRFKKSDAEAVFQTIFRMNGLAIVPTGPPELSMVLVEDIQTSQMLKSSAQHISLKALKSFDRPAEVVSVLVPLQNLSGHEGQRSLNNLIQNHRVGFIASVDQSNAVLIAGFSGNVLNMVDLLRELDMEAGTDRAKEWRRLKTRNSRRGGPMPTGQKSDSKSSR